MVIQTLVTGIAIGGVYSLMAVGYSLIFSILNFSNFAYGANIMLGAFIGYYAMQSLGMPPLVGLLVAMIGAAVVSLFVEKIAYSTLRKRKAGSLYLMISAMGMSIFLENTVIATIGSKFYAFPQFLSGTFHIFGATIGYLDVFAIVFATVIITILTTFINKTKVGTAIRAVSYDPMVSQLNGVNLNGIIAIVFVIAGFLAGISGVFLGMKYCAYPTMGTITNKAYIAAVLGGLGSLPGGIVGGLLLGILESVVSAFISSTYRDLFSFTMMILIIIVRPIGLFGKQLEEKV